MSGVLVIKFGSAKQTQRKHVRLTDRRDMTLAVESDEKTITLQYVIVNGDL